LILPFGPFSKTLNLFKVSSINFTCISDIQHNPNN
jgi:hypothetical protein